MQQPTDNDATPVSILGAQAAMMFKDKGSDGKAKGQIKKNEAGQLMYRANEEHAWQPAVYHNSLRRKFIDQMSQLGSYDYSRARGEHENDITSFLPEQKSWNLGDDREAWHDILHCFLYQGYAVPDYDPGFMYDEGSIVIDLENRPIQNWKEIPLTCSSELEGMIMEIISRQNPSISSDAFRARMPITKVQHGVVKAQYAPSTINSHKTRFRQQAGLLSWNRKAGTLETRHYLETIIPQHMVAANWTKGWAGPTNAQQKRLAILSRGKYPQRANGRNVSPNTRARRDAKEERRLAKLDAKEAAKSPSVDLLDNQSPTTTSLTVDDLQAQKATARFSTADLDSLSDGRQLSDAAIELVLQKLQSPLAYIVGLSEWTAYTNGLISAQDLIPVRTLDFTTFRIVIIPVWVQDHWALAVFDFIDEDIRILDSSNNIDAIAWAFTHTRSITASTAIPNGWSLRQVFSAGHANHYDSGVWALVNAEAIIKGEPLPEVIDISATRARYRSLVADQLGLAIQSNDLNCTLPLRTRRKRRRSGDPPAEKVDPKPTSKTSRTTSYTDSDNEGLNNTLNSDLDSLFDPPNNTYVSPSPDQQDSTQSEPAQPTQTYYDLSNDPSYWDDVQASFNESNAFLDSIGVPTVSREEVDDENFDPYSIFKTNEAAFEANQIATGVEEETVQD